MNARGDGRAAVARAAFSLVEIAIALAVIALVITAALIVIPSGIRTQERARFALYAAAKAEEMIECFNASHDNNPCVDSEAPQPWEVPVSRASLAWDLEARLASHRFGIMPLPTTIARRLDSDGDEIQRLLDDGAYLYYSQPMATTNTQESSVVAPPSEARRLVFGVIGWPQQNAIRVLPWKNWPYVEQYPSPPGHVEHRPEHIPSPDGTGLSSTTMPSLGPGVAGQRAPNDGPGGRLYFWPIPQSTGRVNTHGGPASGNDVDTMSNRSPTFCWEECAPNGASIPGADADVRKVFDWTEPSDGLRYGYYPYACGIEIGLSENGLRNGGLFGWPWEESVDPAYVTPPSYPGGRWPERASCIRYVQAALWYCRRKGLTADDGWDPTDLAVVPGFAPGTPDSEKWKQVQALRFLSHAATCLTRWYDSQGPLGTGLVAGVRIPRVTLDGVPGPDEFTLTHAHIVHYHERCLKLAMSYAAAQPYDWAAPRPLQRTIMTDFPLIEADLFSPTLTGTIDGAPAAGAAAEQWRPVPAQPITNIGVSMSYPDRPIDATLSRAGAPAPVFGDPAHFDLAAPFTPTERCRELVFWSVDWQAYEDCELAPSAPVDASRYPFSAPRANAGFQAPGYERMHDIMLVEQLQYAFRNPENVMLFMHDESSQPANAVLQVGGRGDVAGNYSNMWGYEPHDQFMWWPYAPDDGVHRAMKCFSGAYGADRNFNRQLDRGPVPRGTRMRANPVARFVFYDPRVSATQR